MDGVERSEILWNERSGEIQDSIVDSHEIDSLENSASGDQCQLASWEQSPEDFRSRQRT